MSIRCAVCGSKNVVKEFKKEGYDVTKGVVGTALVGISGALAGAGGKDVTYYHCADCGQVMNRPMSQVESDYLDKLLANPTLWENILLERKKQYKNIEWDGNDNIQASQDIEEQEQLKQQILQEDGEVIKQTMLDFLTQSEKYYALGEMQRDSTQLSKYSIPVLTSIVKTLEREKRVVLKVEKKRNYYAIAGIEEILEKKRIEEEKKREEQRRIQRENINKQIEEVEAKYNKELEKLQKQLSEQEAIFEANRSKIFGAGAKAKKEAKQQIENYSNQIATMRRDYMTKKSSLEAELQNL